jgi:putative pyruvate formate lyase activating enzyme
MDFPSVPELHTDLHNCSICPRECQADRFTRRSGYCRTGASFSISSVCIHHGEEPPVSGNEGICNIFFTGCNLHCVFCQNYQISDPAYAHTFREQTPEEILDQVTSILDQGIHRVGFVSPSHVIPQMKYIIEGIHARNHHPVLVFNTNGYDKVETIKSLEGIIDVYLPDFKYMDPHLSADYSGALDYPEVASKAIKEMYRQKGAALHLDPDGGVESGIIIRHLVLPGHTENSIEVLKHIATEISPKLHVSLMSQYYPVPGVNRHPQLSRTLTPAEYGMVADAMDELGMVNGWKQEMESVTNYRPDFDRILPFETG